MFDQIKLIYTSFTHFRNVKLVFYSTPYIFINENQTMFSSLKLFKYSGFKKMMPQLSVLLVILCEYFNDFLKLMLFSYLTVVSSFEYISS